MNKSSFGFLSAGKLKLLACIFMAIDHIGFYFFPGKLLLRAIGRLAFPIFAFFIAEGCRFTRNKLRYFLQVFSVGLVCALAYYFYTGAFEGNILITFSCSILLIYLLQGCRGQHRLPAFAAFTGLLLCLFFANQRMYFDYGFTGMLVPLCIAMTELFPRPQLRHRLLALGAGLCFVALDTPGWPVQWVSLLALPLLALYSGRPGSRKWKYGFYLFYPAHLLALEAIAQFWIK